MVALTTRVLVREREFFHRYNQCLAALDAYVTQARKMCDLLEACNGDPASVLKRLELVTQRNRENDLRSDYERARKRLLRTAGLNSTATVRPNAVPRSIMPLWSKGVR